MQGRYWLVVASAVFMALSSCKKLEREYCQAHFEEPGFEDKTACCEEYPEDCQSSGTCESSADCGFETPYCHVGQEFCVACLESAHCTVDPRRPLCDEASNMCVGCRRHSDCNSRLCLADGECAAAEDVSYVSDSNASSNPLCTEDMPCQDLTQALAVAPVRKYIKVIGQISPAGATRIDGHDVDIYGDPGTSILTNSLGVVLEIGKQSVIDFFDLKITGSGSNDAVVLKDAPGPKISMTRVEVHAPGGRGVVIAEGDLVVTDSQIYNCLGSGIDLAKGSLVITGTRVLDNQEEGVKGAMGTVEISRSAIRGNRGVAGISTMNASMVTIESSIITGNTGTNGGVSITGRFAIRNSIISKNGSGTSVIGGLSLNSINGLLEFSTVADNVVQAGGTGGISCSGTILVSSSILTGNGGVIDLGCTVAYSLTGPSGPIGMNNMIGNPRFLDTSDPLDPRFFRIGSDSEARDKADQSAMLDVDIDGQPRSDGMKDMGADEFTP